MGKRNSYLSKGKGVELDLDLNMEDFTTKEGSTDNKDEINDNDVCPSFPGEESKSPPSYC
ncbi:hypothetical protein OROMI_022361 [Orobanche minor]